LLLAEFDKSFRKTERTSAHKIVQVLHGFLSWTLFHPAAARGQERIVLVETGSSMPERFIRAGSTNSTSRQPSTDIRYMASGTAESVRNILAGSGDFGGGDAPIPETLLRAAGRPILELPAVLIAL